MPRLQAGSTFKAFVAAAAISEGFIPSQTYYNAPATKNWEGTTFKNCDGNFVFKSGDGQWLDRVELVEDRQHEHAHRHGGLGEQLLRGPGA
ncbi:hypothetical protein FAM14222_000002 [Propionibacterium freudenreichii]|uniref:penicillin-binding transpeptidase domain-containing protein n=1 Tax=Propionibacterium freudenreichii TaxID=1744 RepID=UPI00254BC1EF|nr:penicillin-binding transpeptidase domain-containing protein [Propionibacterium freudenreichii]MDK9591831.1 hypothetical protein [Propionibacterium freudenreichii]